MGLVYKTRLKLNVDTAFDQARILTDLCSLCTEGLVQKVPRIDDRLNLARKHSPTRQVLSNRKAERRVVVFHHALVGVQAGNGEGGRPSINGRNFGLGCIDISLKTRRDALESPARELISHIVEAARKA